MKVQQVDSESGHHRNTYQEYTVPLDSIAALPTRAQNKTTNHISQIEEIQESLVFWRHCVCVLYAHMCTQMHIQAKGEHWSIA